MSSSRKRHQRIPKKRIHQISNFRKWPVFFVSFGLLFLIFLIFLLISKNTIIDEFKGVLQAQNENTVFYDIDRQPFHIIRGSEDRKYVPLEQISGTLQRAVVAIEDARFFKHFGFDPIRIGGAFLRLFSFSGHVQGASTITQQLVKLTLLTPKRTLIRKVKELFIATFVEMEFSKAEILEFYLNTVYLGNRNYGVENAALNFFHKSSNKLSLAEASFIAGLIKKPEGYSPFVDLKKARKRQVLVLKRMRLLKWISNKEYRAALSERMLIRKHRKSTPQLAPYFTSHIMLRLTEKFGHKMVYGGGLRVYTTLNRKLQEEMERVISTKASQERSFGEIAGVSINPETRFVQALVGGIDFNLSEFNRVTQAKRQPGSSFKPILYATALSQGLKPTDIFNDEPIQYTGSLIDDLDVYEPENFSGNYKGPITVSYALRTSNNVVSVSILDRIKIPPLVRKAEQFGISIPYNKGLCLALGCSELTLLQLTNAFAVFANHGLFNKPVFVLKITDSKGKVLVEHKPSSDDLILSPRVNFQMNRMLQDVVTMGTGRNAQIDQVSAGKTGTSDDYRDAWFVGFTPNLVTGFWIGNDDNSPMDREVGGRTPARLWRDFMNSIPPPAIPKHFAISEGFDEVLLCNRSGKLATSFCPNPSWYPVRSENSPTEYCDIHTEYGDSVQICTISGLRASKYCPLDTIENRHFDHGGAPSEFCDVHTSDSANYTPNNDPP